MKIDFDLLSQQYPIADVLWRHFNTRVRHGKFLCPFHKDHTESGSVYTDSKGRQRFKCHTCDKGGDVMELARLGSGSDKPADQYRWLTGSDPAVERPFKETKKPEPHMVFDLEPIPADKLKEIVVGHATPPVINSKGTRNSYTPVLVFCYGDRLVIIRINTGKLTKSGKPGKVFLPLRWARHHGWCTTGWQKGEERLLYREAELEAHPDRPVLVLEGEAKTDLVGALFKDYVVISWAGGSAQMKYQPWARLKGRKVTFWPDADPTESGDDFKTRTQTENAARACQAAEVRIVQPLQAWLDKDCGYDAKDLLEELQREGKQADAARALMESLAVPWEPEPPDDEPPPPPPEGEPDDLSKLPWVLKRTDKGLSLATRDENNILVWLEHLPQENRWNKPGYKGRLSRDVFTNEVLLDGHPLPDGIGPRRIAHDIARHRALVGVTADKVRPMIAEVADLTPVNRLADEVRALTWDKDYRHLLGYAGAEIEGEAGHWARIAGHRWLLGLVKRILVPGSQHDGVLVLEGVQGSGKTSFFRTVGSILGRDLFVELDKLTRDPDTQMLLQGKCVVELSEMTSQRRMDSDALKAMLTSRIDIYRRPYARSPEHVPRTCVFGGSTNEDQYLKDTTGNRRYWIVPTVHPMRLDELARDMPQLLAQAVAYLQDDDEDAQNWLTKEEEVIQKNVAQEREIEMSMFDGLDDYLTADLPSFITRQDVWIGLGIPAGQRGGNEPQKVLARMLEKRGWVAARRDGVSRGPRGFRRLEPEAL